MRIYILEISRIIHGVTNLSRGIKVGAYVPVSSVGIRKGWCEPAAFKGEERQQVKVQEPKTGW